MTVKHWRKTILGLSSFGVIFLTYLGLSQPQWMFRVVSQLRPGALFFVNTDDPVIALTIDDGPQLETTEAILTLLERHRVKATFFVLSDALPSHKAILQDLVASGHELGHHMTADESSLRLSPEDFEAKFLQAHQSLSYYDNNIIWFRPGMGLYNNHMINVTKNQGYQLVLGSLFPYDTHITSLSFAEWFVLNNLDPGDILVLHDGPKSRGERTIQLLDRLLPKIKQKGYRVLTLTELKAYDKGYVATPKDHGIGLGNNTLGIYPAR